MLLLIFSTFFILVEAHLALKVARKDSVLLTVHYNNLLFSAISYNIGMSIYAPKHLSF